MTDNYTRNTSSVEVCSDCGQTSVQDAGTDARVSYCLNPDCESAAIAVARDASGDSVAVRAWTISGGVD